MHQHPLAASYARHGPQREIRGEEDRRAGGGRGERHTGRHSGKRASITLDGCPERPGSETEDTTADDMGAACPGSHHDARAVSSWGPWIAGVHAERVEDVPEVDPDGMHIDVYFMVAERILVPVYR
jgi:hypothetical protein